MLSPCIFLLINFFSCSSHTLTLSEYLNKIIKPIDKNLLCVLDEEAYNLSKDLNLFLANKTPYEKAFKENLEHEIRIFCCIIMHHLY